jgi:hypothetical protein
VIKEVLREKGTTPRLAQKQPTLSGRGHGVSAGLAALVGLAAAATPTGKWGAIVIQPADARELR